MKKVIIFSHESDIDGLGCVILGKLAFNEIDYVLVSNTEKLELTFRDYLQSNKLDKYDRIYITDLALYDPSLTMVFKSPLKDKVLVIDHHEMAIKDNMNRYRFTKIIEKDKKGKRCATELFYEHLVENNLLTPTKALDEFTELTRLEDRWDWKTAGDFGILAHDLSILFTDIGIDEYISKMTSKLLNNSKVFSLSDEEIKIIQTKKDEYENLLKTIMQNAEYFLDENGNKFGMVFADYEYRNELTEYIERINNPEGIKYFITVAMNKGEFGQKSYRSIDYSFDVNEIAMNHGGGGHPTAASVNITKQQKEKSLTLNRKESLKYLADSKYTA